VFDDIMGGMSAGVSKRVTLIIVSITVAVIAFMMSAVAIALPTIGKEFTIEAVLLGWVVTAMTFPQAALLLPAGRLADIYGRKRIFLCGTGVLIVASFLCAIANSAVSLIAYRLFQGIGSGMVFGTSVAILTSVFPPGERGRALGINAAAVFLGISVGPFLGGVLTQHLGWRSIFFLSGFLGLVVIGLTLWRLRGEWAEARGERFDVVGSTVFGISLMVMMYGFTVLLTTMGIVLFVLGVLGLLAFVWWEARIESPILSPSIFRRNTVFVFSNLAMLLHMSTAFAVNFLLSLYLQYNKAFPPQTAGLIMIIHPICTAICTPVAGRLSDKVEPRVVAAVGMVVTCVALVLFIFLNDETALGYIIASLAIFGLGMGIFASPNANAIVSSVEKKFLGVAAGAQGTMRSCGQILGMGIVMILFSLYIGETEITPEYYPAFLTSFKVGFIIFAAISLGGIFAQLVGIRARRELEVES
jgi:EmrB/QacA subfamily drug resistance transporter